MVERKFYSLVATLLFFAFVHQTPANASAQNYCLENSEGVRAYFAPRKAASEIELNAYKDALNSLVKTLEIGHNLEVLLITEASVTKVFSSCFPGCPEQSFGEQIFGGGACKATIAKRDRVNFFKQLKLAFQKALNNAIDGSGGYTAVMSTLAAVEAHEKVNSGNIKDVLVSSMYIGSNISRDNLDSFFVSTVQNIELPYSFPSMAVTGMPVNADLINLWKDLYSLNGQTFKHK